MLFITVMLHRIRIFSLAILKMWMFTSSLDSFYSRKTKTSISRGRFIKSFLCTDLGRRIIPVCFCPLTMSRADGLWVEVSSFYTLINMDNTHLLPQHDTKKVYKPSLCHFMLLSLHFSIYMYIFTKLTHSFSLSHVLRKPHICLNILLPP